MHLLMPMAGAGSRFAVNESNSGNSGESGRGGMNPPKPLREIFGRPFFYWAAEAALKCVAASDITFVVLSEHVRDFDIGARIKGYYADARIVVLPEILPGPVCTCLVGVEGIVDDLPLMINDCDHIFGGANLKDELRRQFTLTRQSSLPPGGGLLTFEARDPRYSYVRYGTDGGITGAVEKQAVSTRGICGAYVFRNAALFTRLADELIHTADIGTGEYYISGLYNLMGDHGYSIAEFPLDYHVSYGTPQEYEQALTSERFRHILFCGREQAN